MQLVCSHCGVKNRVLEQRLSEAPKCGRCHGWLLPGEAVEVSGERLLQMIEGSELPVLVDFWAEWCGPCKMMAPQFAAAAQQRALTLFLKLDTEQAPQVSTRFAVRSIPTLILFKDGREVARLAGAMSSVQLLLWLDQQTAL